MENPADTTLPIVNDLPLSPDHEKNASALMTQALDESKDRLAFVRIAKNVAQGENIEIVFNCRLSSVEGLTQRYTEHLHGLMVSRNNQIIAANEQLRALKSVKK